MAAAQKLIPRFDRLKHKNMPTLHWVYAPVLTWCEWLLAMASPALSPGASQAPGLLFDMNKLFEAHAAMLEEAHVGHDRIVHTQGPPLHLATRGLDDLFLLKPDITVWHIGKDGAASTIDRVVDEKWKRLDPHAPDFGVDEADLYQLLAYAMRYGCTALELAYPMPDGMEERDSALNFNIELANRGVTSSVRVSLKLIPLWGKLNVRSGAQVHLVVRHEKAITVGTAIALQ